MLTEFSTYNCSSFLGGLHSDVVVIGRIGDAVKVHKFFGYQRNAAELERLDAGTHLSVGIPLVDYEIEIQEVVSDETVRVKQNVYLKNRVCMSSVSQGTQGPSQEYPALACSSEILSPPGCGNP